MAPVVPGKAYALCRGSLISHIITASTTSRPGESGIPSRAFTQSVS